ncbi:hypothetical protein [Nocardia sp. NPDC004711]
MNALDSAVACALPTSKTQGPLIFNGDVDRAGFDVTIESVTAGVALFQYPIGRLVREGAGFHPGVGVARSVHRRGLTLFTS